MTKHLLRGSIKLVKQATDTLTLREQLDPLAQRNGRGLFLAHKQKSSVIEMAVNTKIGQRKHAWYASGGQKMEGFRVFSISQLVTSNKELGVNSNKLTSLEIQLRAVEIAGDMASLTAPNDMTAWYCKAYKTLGEGRYIAVANMAKKGNNPKKLFGWLLKQEMNKRG